LKGYSALIVTIILLSSAFLACIPVQAQEDEEASDSAEINAVINGDIPSIKGDWTPINITIVDAFGIDWDKLSASIPEMWMRILWPLNPMFPQPVQRFLGYTGLRFEPEILKGNPRGWYLRMVNNEIAESNPGWIHSITLEAKTDDSAIDYAVVAGIKCIRLDTFGGIIGSSYITIPLKASPLNFIEMRTTNTMKHAGLKSIVSFDVDITNIGYYKDVFKFELEGKNGLIGQFNKQALTLNPDETKKITLSILTPEKIWDPGTPNKIDIYAYSHGDSTRTHIGSLVVVTEGIYISPLVGMILIPIIIFIAISYVLFFYFRQKEEREAYGKPEKPWTIPEEKKYLDELRAKDKKEYSNVIQRMNEEYQSALLWYKSYRNSVKQKEKNKK